MLSSRMTTGLERVARALCELDANPPDATMGGKPLWRDYLPEASAAIMALLEPDKAMMNAAKLEAVQLVRDDFGKIYRAMFDAAMIESSRRKQATRGSLVAGVGLAIGREKWRTRVSQSVLIAG